MSTIAGVTIQPVLRGFTDPNDVIRPEELALASVNDTDGVDDAGSPWSARLYLWPAEASPPSWLAFLQDGFGAEITVPDATRTKAVVVVTISWRGAERLFAVAFGDGRHELRRGTLDFATARLVQLNVIYQGDQTAADIQAAPRIRDIEYVEQGQTAMRTRRQAGRSSDFDEFSFDPDIGRLVGVTGTPVDQVAFGKRISGKTSLRVSRTVEFSALAGICRNIARYAERKDYQRRFRFVDRISEVTETSTMVALDAAVAESLTGADAGAWEFAPPDLVDFDDLASDSSRPS